MWFKVIETGYEDGESWTAYHGPHKDEAKAAQAIAQANGNTATIKITHAPSTYINVISVEA